MQTLIHTSPAEITKINAHGLFDDCLFFSDSEYSMGDANYVYELSVSEDELIDVSELHNEEIIDHIASVLEIDADDAESYLDGSKEDDLSDNDSWFIQAQRGAAAKAMGYVGCVDEDEQGTVYIIPMLNKEKELKLRG